MKLNRFSDDSIQHKDSGFLTLLAVFLSAVVGIIIAIVAEFALSRTAMGYTAELVTSANIILVTVVVIVWGVAFVAINSSLKQAPQLDENQSSVVDD